MSEIIFLQNKELITRIAQDKYEDDEDRETFIQKYHKINFSFLKKTTTHSIDSYSVKVERAFNPKKKSKRTD